MEMFKEFCEKSLLDNFVEKLFEMEFSLFVDDSNDVDIKEIDLKSALLKIREIKNHTIKKGNLGDSLYIKVKKNKKIVFIIRISYHKPLSTFGMKKGEEDVINVLCLDILSWADEIKVHKIRTENYPSELNDSGLKDKEEHKGVVFKKIKPFFPNLKFMDLEDDNYSKVKNAIKMFLQENGFEVLENMNLEEYTLEYEIINED